MANPLPKADVVIVGLGAAAGIASYVLTKAGINVVAIEVHAWYVADYIAANLSKIVV